MCIRLSKSMFMELLGMIQDSISHDRKRNMSLSPVLQLLIALRYYARCFSGKEKYTINIHA